MKLRMTVCFAAIAMLSPIWSAPAAGGQDQQLERELTAHGAHTVMTLEAIWTCLDFGPTYVLQESKGDIKKDALLRPITEKILIYRNGNEYRLVESESVKTMRIRKKTIP